MAEKATEKVTEKLTQKYDLIVVGAGPGGTAAAKTAVDNGLKVLLIERAKIPGQKNMSGSSLWRNISEEIFPGFSNAPFHQGQISASGLGVQWQIDNDEKRYGVTLCPGADAFHDVMCVFRDESDEWFGKECAKKGVTIKTALATDLIWDNSNPAMPVVKGVVTDVGNYEAPLTIDASGLHSILARKAGLAKFGQDKVMVAMKYIYKVPEHLMRERLEFFKDSDGKDVVDWSAPPVLFGDNPAFFAAHACCSAQRGICAITIYHTLEEMIRQKVNIHQRMEWYLKEFAIQNIIKGCELAYVNFHSLTAFDKVGYVKKSYLPGFLLVGDAGGFANCADSWGANSAQWQGREAALLCVEMKAKKDYGEGMCAKYEEIWRNSWVGSDNIPEMGGLFRNGNFGQFWKGLDDVMSTAIPMKFNNNSYANIIANVAPKLLPMLPFLMELPFAMSPIAKVGLKKLDGLMGLVGMSGKKTN